MVISEEKKQYLKEYRQRNKEHISKVAKKKYRRRRDYFISKTKEWRKENPEKVRAGGLRAWYKNHDLCKIRQLTKSHFNHLKKDGKCQNCGSNIKLEFHHIEPFAYDNFLLLCFNCHRVLHGKLLKEYIKDDTLTTPFKAQPKDI